MRLANLLKSKPETDSAGDLDAALDSIIKVERKHAEAKTNLENAQTALQAAQGAAIDGDESGVAPAVERVVGEQAKADALDGLLKQAMDEAIALIAAGSAVQRKRLSKVEEELVDLRGEIDKRRVQDIAKFAKARGLQVFWPGKSSSGGITLPAVSLGADEIENIAAGVKVAVRVDAKQGELSRLRDERQRLNMVVKSAPPVALESLLVERRRK